MFSLEIVLKVSFAVSVDFRVNNKDFLLFRKIVPLHCGYAFDRSETEVDSQVVTNDG